MSFEVVLSLFQELLAVHLRAFLVVLNLRIDFRIEVVTILHKVILKHGCGISVGRRKFFALCLMVFARRGDLSPQRCCLQIDFHGPRAFCFLIVAIPLALLSVRDKLIEKSLVIIRVVSLLLIVISIVCFPDSYGTRRGRS